MNLAERVVNLETVAPAVVLAFMPSFRPAPLPSEAIWTLAKGTLALTSSTRYQHSSSCHLHLPAPHYVHDLLRLTPNMCMISCA
jgi:hypothetical protein